jgi:hypothetical protein
MPDATIPIPDHNTQVRHLIALLEAPHKGVDQG